MKRLLTVVLLALLLTGCFGDNQELDQMMTFRAKLLAGMGCSFDTVITADYQDVLYTFRVSCRCDEQGKLSFTVIEPESISGITGNVDADGGKLTFDDQALAFEPLADGQLSPVSSPWLLVKTLRGGYVSSCTSEDDRLRVAIDDSYEEDALRLDIWFDAENMPEYAELLWADRRILSLEVSNFEIL